MLALDLLSEQVVGDDSNSALNFNRRDILTLVTPAPGLVRKVIRREQSVLHNAIDGSSVASEVKIHRQCISVPGTFNIFSGLLELLHFKEG